MTALSGRTALITGAGRGIGADVARLLATEGAEVLLVARTATEIEEVAEQLRDQGGRARAVPCDLTDLTAVRRLVDGLDRLDVLVNNAGPTAPPPSTRSPRSCSTSSSESTCAPPSSSPRPRCRCCRRRGAAS